MQKNSKKIKILIIISIILLSFVLYFKAQGKEYFDDIFIFNLYQNQKNQQTTTNPNYTFDIKGRESSSVNISLFDTILSKAQVKEKIAPGIKGEFGICINCAKAKTDINYNITFDNKNEKPKNLLFNIKGNKEKYNNIEELEKHLKGITKKGSITNITIEWSWEYENNKKGNIQDTLDGQNINTYNFDINILADEVDI